MSVQLTGEAIFVGIGNLLIHRMVKKMFPNSEGMQLIVSGIMFHLVSEFSGLNLRYAEYKITRTGDRDFLIDTNRRQPCQPSQSTIPDSSLSYSALEYLHTV